MSSKRKVAATKSKARKRGGNSKRKTALCDNPWITFLKANPGYTMREASKLYWEQDEEEVEGRGEKKTSVFQSKLKDMVETMTFNKWPQEFITELQNLWLSFDKEGNSPTSDVEWNEFLSICSTNPQTEMRFLPPQIAGNRPGSGIPDSAEDDKEFWSHYRARIHPQYNYEEVGQVTDFILDESTRLMILNAAKVCMRRLVRKLFKKAK